MEAHLTGIHDSQRQRNLGLFLLWFDDQVSLLDQPAMKFMGGVQTMGCTDRPDFFIPGRFFRFYIQERLDRAGHIMAEFPTRIIDITLYRLHDRFFGAEMKSVPVRAIHQCDANLPPPLY